MQGYTSVHDPTLSTDLDSKYTQTSLLGRIISSKWVPTRKRIIIIRSIAIITSIVFISTWLYASNEKNQQPKELGSTHTEPPLHIEDDRTHRIFRSAKPRLTSQQPMSVRAYDAMSDSCVDEWVAHHTWGPACMGTDLREGLNIDGVWAWVNGSDPLQIASRRRYRPSSNMKMDASHRYVEHDELLFSMRSAVASLGTDVLKRLHILASAYHLPNGSTDNMVGQIPAWLNKKEALGADGRVSLHHDADYFGLAVGLDANPSQTELEKWKEAVIPSFNSLAVESQIHNLDNAASDQLVYFNDDFFTLRKLAVSDYTTPLYGPVIKTFTRLTSMYTPSENTFWRHINPAGEEPGIKRAAWVLGKRFSMRPYYYITHHPRTLWLPLLLEAAQTFPDAFSDTTLSRFRAQSEVPASIQAIFLASWYVVERHREALLWSWVVAKWGGADGVMTAAKKDSMWIELADEASPSKSSLSIGVPVRAPVENAEVFGKANIDIPTSTEYSFSSKDGYALSYVDSMWFWQRPRHGYPDLTKGLIESEGEYNAQNDQRRLAKDPSFVPSKACTISRSTCFQSSTANETASDFFKRVAFAQPKCGDCMITALVAASGQSGIDKFLPLDTAEANREAYSKDRATPPHLPLTSDWTTTDFSLASAIPEGALKHGMTLRSWCTRLIQRYSYVLGSVGSDFYKMERAKKLESKLSEVEATLEGELQTSTPLQEPEDRWRNDYGENDGPLAFLCLNDDIKETGELRGRIDELLDAFFRKMWPGKLSFEVRD